MRDAIRGHQRQSEDIRCTQRALRGHSEGTQRALRGHSESTQRALRGQIEGTERALRGHSEGKQRVLRGQTEGTQRANRGHSEGKQRALRGQTEGTQRANRGYSEGKQRALRGTHLGRAPHAVRHQRLIDSVAEGVQCLSEHCARASPEKCAELRQCDCAVGRQRGLDSTHADSGRGVGCARAVPSACMLGTTGDGWWAQLQ